MELASMLAGEPWTDHPAAADPALAALARTVNDAVSDAARACLAPLIPLVLGTNTGDPRINERLTQVLASHTGAPPPAGWRSSADRQRPISRSMSSSFSSSFSSSGADRVVGWWRRHRLRQAMRRDMNAIQHASLATVLYLQRGSTEDADAALIALLDAAIRATRSVTHPETQGRAARTPTAVAPDCSRSPARSKP